MRASKFVSAMLLTVAIAYALVMLVLLFRPYMLLYAGHFDAPRRFSLVPFATISAYMKVSSSYMRGVALMNLVGNVVVFIPLGLLLQVFSNGKHAWRHLLLALFVPIGVELLQVLLIVGACDIDDVLLNFVGITVGILLFRGCLLACKQNINRARVAALVLLALLGGGLVWWQMFA